MTISQSERFISDQLRVLEDLLKESEPKSMNERIRVIQRVSQEIENTCKQLTTPLSTEFWQQNSHRVAVLEQCIQTQPNESGETIYSTNMLNSVKAAAGILFEKNLTDWINEKRGSPEYDQRLFAAEEIRTCHAQKDTLLDLIGNQLTSLPDLSALLNLRKLDLSHNQLTSLPDLSALLNLKELELSDNQLTSLPDLSALLNLRKLSLRGNQLTSLPDLSALLNLKELELNDNQLTSLPDLSALLNLKELELNDNQLTSLPDLSALLNLKTLDLDGNRLTSLPDLSALLNLKELYLGGNQLTSLPDLSALLNLRKLYLSDNQLTSLPDLSALLNLRELYLSSNQLTSLPDLSALLNLRDLYLSNNQLSTLPNTLAQLSRECFINLENNLISAAVAENFQTAINQARQLNPLQGPRSWHVTINDAVNTESTLEANLQRWGRFVVAEGHQDEFSASSYELLRSRTNEAEQRALNTFLDKLQRTQDFLNPNTHKNTILLMHKMLASACTNDAFKEKFFTLLDDATSSCGDRVAEYFGDMEIQHRMLCQNQTSLQETAQLLIGVERLEKVRVFALAKAKEKHLGDSIEVMLYCKLKLKESLQLPISTEGMLYPGMAHVTDEELSQAKQNILAQTETPDQWVAILVARDLWKDKIVKSYPDTFDLIQDQLEQDLANLEKLPDGVDKTTQQIEATARYTVAVNHEVGIFTEKLVRQWHQER